MSKNIKLGLIIFNLVILAAFHRGDALECYVCHGEDDCVKDYPSEICIDVTTTESNEKEITEVTTENDSSTTTEAEASSSTTEAETSPSTTEAETSPSTTEAETLPSTTEVEASSTTEAEDSSSTTETEASSTTEAETLPSTTEVEASSSTTETETSPVGQGTDEINKSKDEKLNSLPSDTNSYSVKQLYRDNVKSRRRRFALSAREESWSCFKSIEDEKVIERGCINSNPPKESSYELCQSDKCNPASNIHLNFTLILMILTLTITYYIF